MRTQLWRPANIKHLYNIYTTSPTLVQHCVDVIQIFCVCWYSPCVHKSIYFAAGLQFIVIFNECGNATHCLGFKGLCVILLHSLKYRIQSLGRNNSVRSRFQEFFGEFLCYLWLSCSNFIIQHSHLLNVF